MFGNLPVGKNSVWPKVFHDCVIPWSRGGETGRWIWARGGGSGVGRAAGTWFHPQTVWEELEPLWWAKLIVQVWPPWQVGNEEWLGIPTWTPGDSPRISSWRILTLSEPPLSLSLTRSGLVWVGFWAEPAPGRWRKPHDGKESFGRKFFSVCFEQRSEIITALPLCCQTCLNFGTVISPRFILSGFLSNLDLRTISCWHLLSSESSTVINPGFLLPPWSLLMLLNPRSMGTANSCPQPCPESVLALTEG